MLPLVVLVGPTAVGKTEVAVYLAKFINGEVISGDSMQVYRHMNIGTAKIRPEEQEGIPHHLIDIINPDEEYSVAVFQASVEKLIPEIVKRGNVPILVGGTGLYIRSVIDPYDFSPGSRSPEYRKKLDSIADEKGSIYLHDKLKEIDPQAALKIHPNDRRRIIRALEVYHLTGKPISFYHNLSENIKPKYNLAYFGLKAGRETLYNRINARVDKMIEAGLIDEVRKLLAMGYHKNLKSMQGLGYKEIIGYLEGKYDLEEAIRLLKRNTRHFAKRQLTWFKKDTRIYWYNVEKYISLKQIANEIAKKAAGQFYIMKN